MKPEFVDLLACPLCHGGVRLSRVLTEVMHARQRRVMDAFLTCGQCGGLYPVIDAVPRMLPPAELTESERAFLDQPPREPVLLTEQPISPDERRTRLAARLRQTSRIDSLPTEKRRARARHDFEYHIEHAHKKEKFCLTVAPFLTAPPRVVLDVGGGQGGLAAAFLDFFRAPWNIALDYQLSVWATAERVGRDGVVFLRDRDLTLVRGDGARLPFADGTIDLVVTASALEHIPAWREALAEMMRVGQTLLLAYGPNRRFPYDPGHTAAPLFHGLPESWTCRIAWLWHRLRRTGWSYEEIRESYRKTNYISIRDVRRVLGTGGEVHNVLREFLHHSVRADYHYMGSHLKGWLRRHDGTLGALCAVVRWLQIDPFVYLVWQRRRSG